jgi:phosphoribosylanthranilate isomerase
LSAGVSDAVEAAGRKVRVKICGVRTVADARAAAGAGADMIGLNFFAGSRRCVDLARAREIAACLAPRVWRVGVFVNVGREEIDRVRHDVGLSAIQLHGEEPPELLEGWGVPVIRAVHLGSRADAELAVASLAPDYFLAEGCAGPARGGSGAQFEPSWAAPLPAERLFVAGGLTPDNVAGVVRALRPFAVDVASGVESEPGVKSAALVAAFIEHAKAA